MMQERSASSHVTDGSNLSCIGAVSLTGTERWLGASQPNDNDPTALPLGHASHQLLSYCKYGIMQLIVRLLIL